MSFPNFSAARFRFLIQVTMALSSGKESSSVFEVVSYSCHSIQPPGLRLSKACRSSVGTSLKLPPMLRRWMKSNFLWLVHLASASSISKFRFGGSLNKYECDQVIHSLGSSEAYQRGCIALRSIPMTSNVGCWLDYGIEVRLIHKSSVGYAYSAKSIAQIPYALSQKSSYAERADTSPGSNVEHSSSTRVDRCEV